MKLQLSLPLALFVCFFFFSVSLASVVNNNPSPTTLEDNDNEVLNYALTLEHLEATFYAGLLKKFSVNDFKQAGYKATDYTYFQLISAHETAHANLLTATLTSRGAKAVRVCTYDFNKGPVGPLTSLQKYVMMSRVLENTGASAYDGAINSIYDKGIQEVAASIATVEGRHASYLNNLNNEVPFPSDFDTALNDTTVFAAVTPIFVSCPDGTPTLPKELIVVPVSTRSQSNPSEGQLEVNDLDTLNFALTLEHLEATFYNTFQKKFSQSDFKRAGFSTQVYTYVNLIKAHEDAHVSALTSTIQSLGGKPVPPCTYDFSTITSVQTYLETGRAFEAVGVSAYDGAVNTISDLTLRQVAATIATVEGRHTAYLSLIQGLNPFPNITDLTRTPSEVISVVSPKYIVRCPYTFQLPKVLVVVSQNNGSSSSALSLRPFASSSILMAFFSVFAAIAVALY